MQVPLPTPPRVANRTPSWGRRARANPWSYLYLAPMAVMLVVFVLYPSIASLGYTLYSWNGIGDPSTFVGLKNFRDTFADPIFWDDVTHTLIYTAILVPVQLTFALVLALVLNNPKLKGRTFYRAVFFIPVVTAPAVVGVVVQILLTNFSDNLNAFMTSVGIQHQYISWLGDPRFALGCIIVVGIWNTLGYNLIYFLAGLQSIPAELYESARLDGAGPVRQFRSITVPLLRTTGVVILILALIGSLQVFDLVQALTGGGPGLATETIAGYIYRKGFDPTAPNIGAAAAAAFFSAALILAFTALQIGLGRLFARRSAARA